jgi:hypothetical protein
VTTWGTITIGRATLRETVAAVEVVNASTGVRSLKLAGQESCPPLTAAQLIDRHDAILGLYGALVQVQFSDKSDRNGYYVVHDTGATQINQQGETLTCDWTLSLDRIGAASEVDLESRLTGIKRANDFALTGEAWHAPCINHQAYDVGASIPSTMTRSTADGTITVYRSLGTGVLPRWGADVADYMKGRVRIISATLEKTGLTPIASTAWELNNGLVQVTPGTTGTIAVASWTAGVWKPKQWMVDVGGGALGNAAWDTVTILRNDPEACVLRLACQQGPSEAGRVTLDLTLRRGSRFVECYLQHSTSATTQIYLASAETCTNNSASGYIVATSNDADGNKVTAGSARAFTMHANGGVVKATSTALDCYLGVVLAGSSAVSGDAATDVRNQYIGALPEIVGGVRR